MKIKSLQKFFYVGLQPLLRGAAAESMYELLNFGRDIPSASSIPNQVEHQPQFDNTDYIEMKSFCDANISNQVQSLSDQKQPSTLLASNIPISDNLDQPQFNLLNNAPVQSNPDTNVLYQQCQLNIPNATLVNAVVNFMCNNPNQNGQNNVNQIFSNQANGVNSVNDETINDSFSSMSISSGPILDSQFAIEMCGDFIKHLDNNGGETIIATNNQSSMPAANEQIMNYCANTEFIRCAERDPSLTTENIDANSDWNTIK